MSGPANARVSDAPPPPPSSAARPSAANGIRALATDTALLLGGQYASAGLSFLSTVVAAAIAGPGAYGQAAVAIAFPSLAWSLTTVKSGTVTTRYFAQDTSADEASAFFRLGLSVDLVAAVLASLVVVGFWAVTQRSDSTSGLSVIFALSLPFASCSGTTLAFLTARRRFLAVAALQVFEKATLLVLTTALLMRGHGASGVVIALAVSQSLSGLAGLVTCLKSLELSARSLVAGGLPRIGSRWPEVRAALGWNYLSSTTGGVLANVPLIALGVLRSPVEAGYCRLALSLMNVSAYLDAALVRATYSRLAAEATSERLANDCKRFSFQAGVPAALALAVATLALPTVIPMALGVDYTAMVRGAQIVVMGVALTTGVFWVQPLLYASGRFKAWALISGAVACGVAALTWPVVSAMGFIGVTILVATARVITYVAGGLTATSILGSRSDV